MIDQINNSALIDGMFLEFSHDISVNPYSPIHVEMDLSNSNGGKVSSFANFQTSYRTFLFINGSKTEFTTSGVINDIKDCLKKLENPKGLKFFKTLKFAIEKEFREQFPEDYI
jgi:hypothetical protein